MRLLIVFAVLVLQYYPLLSLAEEQPSDQQTLEIGIHHECAIITFGKEIRINADVGDIKEARDESGTAIGLVVEPSVNPAEIEIPRDLNPNTSLTTLKVCPGATEQVGYNSSQIWCWGGKEKRTVLEVGCKEQ